MKQLLYRILSIALCLALLLSSMPVQTFAQESSEARQESAAPVPSESVYKEPEVAHTMPPVELQASEVEFSSLRGTVVDVEGNGIPGVGVWIYSVDERTPLTRCTTNSSGTWVTDASLYEVFVGFQYHITYYKAGYEIEPYSFDVTAEAGGTVVPDAVAVAIPGLVCTESDYEYTTDNISQTAVITAYHGTAARIRIPSELGGYPVVEISDYVFAEHTELIAAALPETLTTLQNNAFGSCENLEQVYLPNALTHMGEYAFAGCAALTGLTLPDSLEEIGYRAFADCLNLSSVSIPLNWTYSGGNIFEGCTSLTSVTVPEGMEILPGNAFSCAGSVLEVQLPEGLKEIGGAAFYGCEGITQVTLPASLEKIGNNVFQNCAALAEVEFPETLTYMGEYAFAGCAALTELTLPDSLEEIGYRAFADCLNLSSVSIPLNWTYSGGNIFEGCTSLTSVTVPEGMEILPGNAFSCAGSVLEVQLPEGLKEIGGAAFYGCEGITQVTLPASLEKIGDYGFQDCSRLLEIQLPDSVEEIGHRAFANCDNLAHVILPVSWSVSGGDIFADCEKVTRLTIPEGATGLPDNALCNTPNLRSVVLPDSLRRLGASAFSDCARLVFCVVPAHVEEIGDSCFSGCTSLRYVTILSLSCSIGENLLCGSPNATLKCKWLSDVTLYAIRNNIEFHLLQSSSEDFTGYLTDIEHTSFYTPSDIVTVSGSVPMTLSYQIPEETFASLSNQMLRLTFSPSLELLEDSLTLNGTALTNYEYTNERELSFRITASSGTVQLYARPVEAGYMAALAEFCCENDDVNQREKIGIVYLNVPLLQLNVPDQSSRSSVEVSGVTKADEVVELSVAGTVQASVKANKDGTFRTAIELPSPVSGTSYTITATLQSDSTVTTAGSVLYSAGAPTLTKFDMYYHAHDLMYLDLLHTDGSRLTNPIFPGQPFKFVVCFDNYDKLGKVYIASTKTGIVSKMQALPTDTPGEYIAEGYFEGTSADYVPGTINVYYMTILRPEDVSEDLTYDDLPDEWKAAEKEVIIDSGGDYVAKITLSEEQQVTFESHENVTLEDLRQSLLGDKITTFSKSSSGNTLQNYEEDDWEPVISFFKDLKDKYKDNVLSNVDDIYNENQDVVAVVKDDTVGIFIYVFWDSAKKAFYSAGAKFVGTYFIYENSIDVSWSQSATVWGFMVSVGDTVVHAYDVSVRLNSALEEINSSTTLKENQKEYARQKLEQLTWWYGAVGLLRIAGAAANFGFTYSGHPIIGTLISTVMNLFANFAENFLNNALDYYKAGGKGSFLKWLIDPSGYVYDLDTQARLAGVTVTAYWIPYDEEDPDFWDSTPEDTEYGILWDASEYSQQNPLITDSEGCYAWEVPEGWWRVKYEKHGYETAWSDWMTVPPMQTEVNIGMKSDGTASAFNDVPEGAYYTDAVAWAYNSNPRIAEGTSNTTFSPNQPCTRAQVVTFLWRAYGCPESESTESSFIDVAAGSYYDKAVLWAVENEITQGTSATTFSPNQPCTRAQVVTFLWRAAGSPEPGATENGFQDVKENSYYEKAVLWAIENDITKGTSESSFSPNTVCSRAQVVTFLYRALAK